MTENTNIVPEPGVGPYYLEMHRKCTSVIEESLREPHLALQSESHDFLFDLSNWLRALAGRPETVVLESAVREYQYALLAVVQGCYRQAFMALRYFLESSLCAIHLSLHELELRLWLLNKRDVKWGSILEGESGLFSKKVASVLCPELTDEVEHYRTLAGLSYRDASEYVHQTTQKTEGLPQEIAFSKDIFEVWHALASNIRLVITFALFLRYFKSLSTDSRISLEAVILDQLAHIPAIRDIFDSVEETHE